ncbi:MAG: adenylate/guanylate cyclase domain-containing protein [SAR324 cluster bacterium]|nr:adenylate/guanylate cyclase domain-containing protein [SAR324 cluster bacterium]
MSPINFSPTQKRNISKILPFGIICCFFGVLWTVVERGLLGNLNYYPATGNPYQFEQSFVGVSVGALLIGWTIGIIEILFLKKIFIGQSFGKKIFIKTSIYISTLCIFLLSLTIILNSIVLEVSLFDPLNLNSVTQFITNFAFWSVIIYMGTVVFIMLFFSEVSDQLGQSILKDFILGKYHKPREEERIFMFLDMKSSTSIAEKLGHIKFYELLNEYYKDLTEAITKTSGEIYKYVGDEVIISWTLKEGVKNENCIQCFLIMKKTLDRASGKYLKKFGLVPGFKAGLHFGKTTIGEIGILKKEIAFSGDVLNTTARIQSECNSYEVDILISEKLINLFKNSYDLTEIGECELRGKEEKIKLFTLKTT